MVRDTSIEAYCKEVKPRLEPDEQAVFEILYELGPCHDRRILEALNQKEAFKPRAIRRRWEINAVTGRRNGLLNKNYLMGEGVVVDLGKFKGTWNGRSKTYHFWAIRGDRRPLPHGWWKVPEPNGQIGIRVRELGVFGEQREMAFAGQGC